MRACRTHIKSQAWRWVPERQWQEDLSGLVASHPNLSHDPQGPIRDHVSVNKVCTNFWSLVSTCTHILGHLHIHKNTKRRAGYKIKQKSERESDSKVLSYNSWLDSEKVVAAPSTEWVCTDVGRVKVWFIDLWCTLEWPRMNGVTVLKVQDNMGHFVTQETKVVGLCQSWPQRDKI